MRIRYSLLSRSLVSKKLNANCSIRCRLGRIWFSIYNGIAADGDLITTKVRHWLVNELNSIEIWNVACAVCTANEYFVINFFKSTERLRSTTYRWKLSTNFMLKTDRKKKQRKIPSDGNDDDDEGEMDGRGNHQSLPHMFGTNAWKHLLDANLLA